MATQSPYNDRKAECSCLWHLYASNKQGQLFGKLREDDFYHKDCRAMFERMRTAYGKGHPLKGDATVKAALAGFVADMGSDYRNPLQAAEALILMAKRRQSADTVAEIMQSVDDFSVSADELQQKVHQIVEDMQDPRCGAAGAVAPERIMDAVLAGIEQARQGNSSQINTGLPAFDKYQSFDPGDLIVIGARPSCGKTALAISMSIGMVRQGLKVGLVCMEMTREGIGRRYLSQMSGIPLRHIKDGNIANWMAELSHAQQEWRRWCDSKAISLSVGSGEMTAITCRELIRRWVGERGTDVVFIDYLQRLDPIDKRDDDVRALRKSCKMLKQCAKDLGIRIVLLAQLNRESESGGRLTRPRMRHLKGSGDIEQEADIIWLLWRPEREIENAADWPSMQDMEGNAVEIGKNRLAVYADKYRDGPTWRAVLRVEPETMRFWGINE